MRRVLYLLAAAAALSIAADTAPWPNKPVADWDDDDARLILNQSPWSKSVVLDQVRDLSPDERRNSGDWEADIGHGVGLAGIGIFGPERAREAIAKAHAKPDLGSVLVRWESAATHAAENKLGVLGAIQGADESYAIAIFDIALPSHYRLEPELKGVAYLQRASNKKQIKPFHVEIDRLPDGKANVIYLFRRTAEITRKDRYVLFVAQVGRLFVAQYFLPEQMQLAGRLEL